jgi:hypothetical protein
MLIDVVGRENYMGVSKNILVLGEYRMEANMHQGCLNGLNRIESGNNSEMTF